ncbi:MAG TPA: cupin, partial [Ancylobacter sp.]
MKIILATAMALFALTAQAADKPPIVVTKLFTGTQTNTGQPIILPQKNVEVIVSTYDIAPGAVLPQHEHPFARYAYVMAGTIEVTNTEVGTTKTYKTGDF